MENILILAPHTDDGEFGCGGTVSRFIEEAKNIYYVAFSSAEKSVPKGFPNDILIKEVKEATNFLGIKQENVILHNFDVREFPKYRQDILEIMIRLNEEINPDLVFLPSEYDTHQDHHVIAIEGFRAFKKTSILGYEVPWNNLSFKTCAFIVLEERHLLKKIVALECYKSQSGKTYASEDFIRSLAKVRGTQIGVNYAEAFDLVRWILR